MKKNKYDIAISVAEEDLQVANLIAKALKDKGISYYLYTEHLACNWGRYILEISLGTYSSEAKYVLILTSEIFVKKYWAGIESQISQIFSSGKAVYILQLRLDDTPVDGLSRYRMHVDWNDNADQIASMIADKIHLTHASGALRQKKMFTAKIMLAPAILVASALVYFIINKQQGVIQKPSLGQLPPASDSGLVIMQNKKETISGHDESARQQIQNKEKNAAVYPENEQKEMAGEQSLHRPEISALDSSLVLKINGTVFSEARASSNYIKLMVMGNGKIAFSGNSGIFPVKGTMLLKGNSLVILTGNITGALSLMENASAISGMIQPKGHDNVSNIINYRVFAD